MLRGEISVVKTYIHMYMYVYIAYKGLKQVLDCIEVCSYLVDKKC